MMAAFTLLLFQISFNLRFIFFQLLSLTGICRGWMFFIFPTDGGEGTQTVLLWVQWVKWGLNFGQGRKSQYHRFLTLPCPAGNLYFLPTHSKGVATHLNSCLYSGEISSTRSVEPRLLLHSPSTKRAFCLSAAIQPFCIFHVFATLWKLHQELWPKATMQHRWCETAAFSSNPWAKTGWLLELI